MSIFNRFAKDESGATAIEYGLIAALVSVAIIAVLGTLGDNLKSTFQSVSDQLSQAGGGTNRSRSRASAVPAAADAASARGGASWTASKEAEPCEDHRFSPPQGVVRPGAALLPVTEAARRSSTPCWPG